MAKSKQIGVEIDWETMTVKEGADWAPCVLADCKACRVANPALAAYPWCEEDDLFWEEGKRVRCFYLTTDTGVVFLHPVKGCNNKKLKKK